MAHVSGALGVGLQTARRGGMLHGLLDAEKNRFGREQSFLHAHGFSEGIWYDDLVIPVPGRWTARLEILVSDFDMVKIEAPVDIRP